MLALSYIKSLCRVIFAKCTGVSTSMEGRSSRPQLLQLGKHARGGNETHVWEHLVNSSKFIREIQSGATPTYGVFSAEAVGEKPDLEPVDEVVHAERPREGLVHHGPPANG